MDRRENIVWTPEKIREDATNWTLASDAGVLQYLENFSEKLITRTKTTLNNVDEIFDELSDTKIKLANVTNQFMNLQHTQFIESRVYEEDETVVDISENLNTNKENNENVDSENVELMRKVIQGGLDILNKHFERVEVPNSDSEDESEGPSIIVKPKDVYGERPLPYVIGSDEWFACDDVGLKRSDSSESLIDEQIESDDSLAMDSPIMKLDDNISESSRDLMTHHYDGSNKHGVNNHEYLNGANDTIFKSSSVNSDNDVSEKKANTKFAEELAARLGNVIETNRVLPSDKDVYGEPSIKQSKPVKKIESYGIFADEPPPLDEVDRRDVLAPSIVGNKYMSPGGGLFDGLDEEEDDSIWNVHIKDKKRLPEKNVLEENENTPTEQDSMTSALKENKKKKSSGLFDDVNDDIDNIFSTNIKRVQPFFPESKPSNILPLINDQPPPTEEAVKKKPVGGISIFGIKGDALTENLSKMLKKPRSHSIHSDSENENDGTGDSEMSTERVDKTRQITEPVVQDESNKVQAEAKKFINLFDDNDGTRIRTSIFDDDDDDTFDFLSTKTKKNKLFEDEDLPKMSSNTKSDLFTTDDDYESSDLFIVKSSQDPASSFFDNEPPPLDEVGVKSTSGKPVDIFKELDDSLLKNSDLFKNSEKGRRSVKSIFDDDDKFNIDSLRKSLNLEKSKKLEEEKRLNLFEADSKNSDAFKEKNVDLNQEKDKGKDNSVPKEASINSFDDANSEKPDLFKHISTTDENPISKQTEEKTAVFEKKNSRLFDEKKPNLFDEKDLQEESNLLKSGQADEEGNSKLSKNKNSAIFDDKSSNLFEEDSSDLFKTKDSSSKDKNSAIFDKKSSNIFEEESSDLFKTKDSSSKDKNSAISDEKSSNLFEEESSDLFKTKDSSSKDKNSALFDEKSSNLFEEDNSDLFKTKEPSSKDKSSAIFDKKSSNLFEENSSDLFKTKEPSSKDKNSAIFDEKSSNLFEEDSSDLFKTKESSSKDKNSAIFDEKASNLFEEDSSDLFKTKEFNSKDKISNLFDDKNTNLFKDTKTVKTDELFEDTVVNKNEIKSKASDVSDLEVKTVERVSASDKEEKSNSDQVGAQELVSKFESNKEGITKEADKENAVLPGKLKHTLNINVSALIPGAAPKKALKQDLRSDSVQESSSSSTCMSPVDTNSPNLVRSVSFDEPLNNVETLQNLTQERARIPIKRKPSSRRARQQAIRASIVDNAEDLLSSSETVNTNEVVANIMETENNQKNTEKSMQKNISETITDVINGNKRPPTETTVEPDSAILTDNNNRNKNINVIQSLLSDEDDFFTSVLKENKSTLDNISTSIGNATANKEPNIFDDNTLVSNHEISVETNVSNREDSVISNYSNMLNRENSAANKKLDISSRDDSVTNKSNIEESITGKVSQEDSSSSKLLNISNREELPTKKISTNLFDDDDEDDLFVTSLSKNLTQKSKKSSAPSLFEDDNEDIFSVLSGGKKVGFGSKNEKTSGLFESSASSTTLSKDVLGENATKKKLKTVSLFGEDDDNDDDLFKPGASKLENKIRKESLGKTEQDKKKVEPKADSKQKTTGLKKSSLFDDDDDDSDDLFGTNRSQTKAVSSKRNTTKPEPSSGKIVKPASQPVFEDPLMFQD